MKESVNTVVVGAGQAGLCISYYLTRKGVPHVVLEERTIGGMWASGLWDSFTLVTPNWTVQLPDYPIRGHDPDEFMSNYPWPQSRNRMFFASPVSLHFKASSIATCMACAGSDAGMIPSVGANYTAARKMSF